MQKKKPNDFPRRFANFMRFTKTKLLFLVTLTMALSLLRITMGANHSQTFKKLQSFCKKRSKVKFPQASSASEKSTLTSRLTPLQFRVTQDGGTERAFAGEFVGHKGRGTYGCVVCGQELFSSKTKYESYSGWPSFYDVIEQNRVVLFEDMANGLHRIEVVCAECGAHLGHVFDDGPKPTNTRYCVNSASLRFYPKSSRCEENSKIPSQPREKTWSDPKEAPDEDACVAAAEDDAAVETSTLDGEGNEDDAFAPSISEFKCTSSGCGP